jgi:CheY-like chemotaxis protein
MNINLKPLPLALAFAAHRSARAFPRLMLIRAEPAPLFAAPRSIHNNDISARRVAPRGPHLGRVPLPGAPSPETLSIYAVDDQRYLTDLYARILEHSGLRIRTFNDRAEALSALKAESQKPALLITDYLGFPMPADEFMQACREVHPWLRILMASGFDQGDMRLSRVKPDRFIRKPFSPEEFRHEVSAVLAE